MHVVCSVEVRLGSPAPGPRPRSLSLPTPSFHVTTIASPLRRQMTRAQRARWALTRAAFEQATGGRDRIWRLPLTSDSSTCKELSAHRAQGFFPLYGYDRVA